MPDSDRRDTPELPVLPIDEPNLHFGADGGSQPCERGKRGEVLGALEPAEHRPLDLGSLSHLFLGQPFGGPKSDDRSSKLELGLQFLVSLPELGVPEEILLQCLPRATMSSHLTSSPVVPHSPAFVIVPTESDIGPWEVVFYESANADRPAEAWLREQDPKVQARFAWVFDLLEEHGTSVREPYVAHLRGKIWEVRTE